MRKEEDCRWRCRRWRWRCRRWRWRCRRWRQKNIIQQLEESQQQMWVH